MACNCGNSKKADGTPRVWLHIGTDGKVIKSYSSETDARMAASRNSGTRVRPA